MLALVASFDGNVLTINQTIPLQGMANVVISVETSNMTDRILSLLDALNQHEGVKKAAVIGRG